MNTSIQTNIAFGADWNKAAERGSWSYKPFFHTDKRVVSYSGMTINLNGDEALKNFVVSKIQGRPVSSEKAGNRKLADELPKSLKQLGPLTTKALRELGL